MTASPRLLLRVNVARDGHTEQVYACDLCDDGRILGCPHGVGCPCSGMWSRCEDCNGESEVAIHEEDQCLECLNGEALLEVVMLGSERC